MNEILLSIIVPVYNVEKYLNKCIESIINNGFNRRCELILVDDGATDSSGCICDTYKAANIAVIHKENGGLASARNVGLDYASGKYIAFIDSDDYIARNSIVMILNELEKDNNIDVYFMQSDKVYHSGKETPLGDCIKSENVNNKTKSEVLEYLAKQSKFAGSACTKIYNRCFLKKYLIHFPDDKRFGEDLFFSLECIYYASTYGALNFPFYKYRQQREGSITYMGGSKAYLDGFLFLKDAVSLLTRNKKSINIIAEKCMSFVAYEYSLQVWHYTHICFEDRTQARKLLDKYKWVMKYASSRKTKAISIMINIWGYNFTARILNGAKKLADMRNR